MKTRRLGLHALYHFASSYKVLMSVHPKKKHCGTLTKRRYHIPKDGNDQHSSENLFLSHLHEGPSELPVTFKMLEDRMSCFMSSLTWVSHFLCFVVLLLVNFMIIEVFVASMELKFMHGP